MGLSNPAQRYTSSAAALRAPLAAAVVLLFMLPAAYAADPGTIVGVITDAAGRPVAHATVTAVKADDHAIRATVSGADGVYSFADRSHGNWSLSWEAEAYQET